MIGGRHADEILYRNTSAVSRSVGMPDSLRPDRSTYRSTVVTAWARAVLRKRGETANQKCNRNAILVISAWAVETKHCRKWLCCNNLVFGRIVAKRHLDLTTQLRRADSHSPLVTILVVDTDPTQVRALARQLRGCGYQVLEATSFPEAQRIWDAEHPQVLVADVRLEAYNGLHLLIRARAVRPDVTAIITSPVFDRVLADETRRLGGTLLMKPVDVGDIVATIEHHVPVVARAPKVSLTTLIYREFHDADGAPALARRAVPPSEQDMPASSAHAAPKRVRAASHGRR